ncbi:hypothetical protein [Tahibacter caeni]|uniref:hypothetical protein n=1 Tax=Tahibacter caeni TaxID=1453545 RepID=UPI0021487DD2|nr:hypothetical protein [Tahibacter caeni]
MASFFFSGLSETFGQPLLRNQLPPALRSIVDEQEAVPEADSLSFDGDDKPSRSRRIRSKHPELSEKDLQLATQALDQIERRREARRRFWVQLTVSLVVLAGAGYLLAMTAPGADTQKALFGLIGTVIGYWLR